MVDLGPSSWYMKSYGWWTYDLVGLGSLVMYLYEWMINEILGSVYLN